MSTLQLMGFTFVTKQFGLQLQRNICMSAALLKVARLGKESVKVSDYCERKGTRQDWQKVKPKGKSHFEWMLRTVKNNDTMISNSDTAARISNSKMDSLKQSLLMKGFCRECKPYEPPSDYEQIIKQIAEQVFNRVLPSNWLDTTIDNYINKFQLLVRCEKVFNHELPNSELHRIESLRDVCEYYSTPVRGINSYDALNRNQQNLPGNLYVIPEPISFDAKYFDGLDAYPNSPIIETGLRAKKKYPDLKVNVVWPDV